LTPATLRLVTILFCLSLLTTAVPVSAQQAALRGVVQDAAGASVPGVLVVLERGLVTHEAVSDSQGTFAFPRLTAGAVRVSASLSGFQSFREDVVLGDGEERELTIRLQPEAASGRRDRRTVARLQRQLERTGRGQWAGR
jgi:hypothetical protein